MGEALNLAILLTLKDELSEKLNNAKGGLSDMKGALLGVGAAAAAGIGVATKVLGDAVNAAAEEEQGILRLKAAVEANGGAWDEVKDKIEDYLAAELKRTALDDGEGRASLARLVTITKNVDESMKLLALAQDMAIAKGIDLRTATEAVGKAYMGNTMILKQYGIDVKNTEEAEKEAAKIAEELAKAKEKLADMQANVSDTQRKAAIELELFDKKMKELTTTTYKVVGGGKAHQKAIEAAELAHKKAAIALAEIDEKLKKHAAGSVEYNKLMLQREEISRKLAEADQRVADTAGRRIKVEAKIKEGSPEYRKLMLEREELAKKAAGSNDKLAEQMKKVAELEEKLKAATEAVAASQKDALSPIEQLRRAVQGQAEAFGDSALGAQKKLNVALENIKETIGGALLPVVATFTQTLADMAIDVLPRVQGALQSVTDFMVEHKTVVAAVAVAVGTVLVAAFTAWAASAVAAAAATMAAMAPVVLPIMAIVAAVGLLAAAWESDWGGMRTTLTDIWENKLRPVFEAIKTWFTETLPQGLQRLWEAVQERWNAIRDTISAVWNTIRGWFETIWDWYTVTLPDGLQQLYEAVVGRWNDICDAIGGAWDTIRGWFEDMKTWLTETLPNAALSMKDAVVEKVGLLRDKLAEAWGNILNAATEKWNDIVDAIKGAFSIDWGAVGRSILEGIWNGISGAWSWLQEKLRGLANSILSTIRGALGISSPSRVFYGIGRDMILGMVQGVQDTAKAHGVIIAGPSLPPPPSPGIIVGPPPPPLPSPSPAPSPRGGGGGGRGGGGEDLRATLLWFLDELKRIVWQCEVMEIHEPGEQLRLEQMATRGV